MEYSQTDQDGMFGDPLALRVEAITASDTTGSASSPAPLAPQSRGIEQSPPPEQGAPEVLYLEWLLSAAQDTTVSTDPFSWMSPAGASVGASTQDMRTQDMGRPDDDVYHLHPTFLAGGRGHPSTLPGLESQPPAEPAPGAPVPTTPPRNEDASSPPESPPPPPPPSLPSNPPSPVPFRSPKNTGDYKCEYCNESFTRRHDVKRHQKKGMLVCYIGSCPRRGGQVYSTPRYDAMKRHLIGAHNVAENDVPTLESFERQAGVGGCAAMD